MGLNISKLGLLRKTYSEWSAHRASSLAAALSYYTVFSLPSLLIIVVAITSIFFEKTASERWIFDEFQGLFGQKSATLVWGIVKTGNTTGKNIIATAAGIAVLLLGATGVFSELQSALNSIWEVKPRPGAGFRYIIKKRLLSFSMVLVIGFLLLVSLVISTALAALGKYISGLWEGSIIIEFVLHAVDILISIGFITVLFAMMFKLLPDAKVAWGDVWLGAFVTAFLFTAGKFLIGLYLGRSTVASAYGAAGSLVIILLWINYSSLIFYYGAEFTKLYADEYGSKIQPARYAERSN